MKLSIKARLFLILFTAGFIGVLSFLLVDFSALIALFPPTPGTEIPTFTPIIKVLTLIQPTVILALAVFVGVKLAPRVGLSAPFAEALASRVDSVPTLKRQLMPGLIGGIIGGAAIVLLSAVFRQFLLPESIERIGRLGKLLGIPTRLLYGGITEELLLRWGFMTLVVWLGWRVFQKKRSSPTKGCFSGAILISAVVFAVGHLPIAFLILPEAGPVVTFFVIVANSVFGLVAGYLYWKKGLESAIIAHMFCHVVLVAANYAGAYF